MEATDYIQSAFPNLKNAAWQITSEPDRKCNCIAWAVNRKNEWWWPSKTAVWPDGVPMEVTLEAFAAALATEGFQSCEHGDMEAGFEKVALYARDGMPKHAARQLPNGHWTSKLGRGHDIQHETPQTVGGAMYGSVVLYFKREKLA